MAKEIEKRAEEYVTKNFSRIGDCMLMDEGMKTLYIEAATEQRKIDIEKACEAYCETCDTKGCEGFGDEICYWVNYFRKKLEDKL